MTGKTLSLITAAAIAAGSAAAHASDIVAAPIPLAHSYADLLEPIPNALERLKAADSQAASEEGGLVEAQYSPQGPGPAYHHHHHHHHHSRRWYMRHGYFWNGGQWMLRPIHHHHHHHHHHHSSY